MKACEIQPHTSNIIIIIIIIAVVQSSRKWKNQLKRRNKIFSFEASVFENNQNFIELKKMLDFFIKLHEITAYLHKSGDTIIRRTVYKTLQLVLRVKCNPVNSINFQTRLSRKQSIERKNFILFFLNLFFHIESPAVRVALRVPLHTLYNIYWLLFTHDTYRIHETWILWTCLKHLFLTLIIIGYTNMISSTSLTQYDICRFNGYCNILVQYNFFWNGFK